MSLLLGLVTNLKEPEGLLARHLLLSPGDRSGYAYLKQPFYAAGVLGCRLSEDRRSRERAVSSIQESGMVIMGALEELESLPAAQEYLQRALEIGCRGCPQQHPGGGPEPWNGPR